MTTINRIGGQSQEHRPLTPYEKGQMLTHYPTVGPTEMARRLHRTISSVKYHWGLLRLERRISDAPMTEDVQSFVNRQYGNICAA